MQNMPDALKQTATYVHIKQVHFYTWRAPCDVENKNWTWFISMQTHTLSKSRSFRQQLSIVDVSSAVTEKTEPSTGQAANCKSVYV